MPALASDKIQTKGEWRMSLKELMAKGRWATEEAWCKSNLDALDEIFAPDFIIHAPSFPDIKGLEAYKQYILTARQAFTNIRFDWEEMIGEGNTIACRYTMRMKHTGVSPRFPVPPTGKELVLKGCAFLHLKNGKAVEEFQYNDYLGVFQQLGLVGSTV
jgi:predicted ester cyclase